MLCGAEGEKAKLQKGRHAERYGGDDAPGYGWHCRLVALSENPIDEDVACNREQGRTDPRHRPDDQGPAHRLVAEATKISPFDRLALIGVNDEGDWARVDPRGVTDLG